MVFVTGATGYIGSHTIVSLINKGYEVIGADNFYNSKPEVLDKIEEITGKRIKFYEEDLTDINAVRKIFNENPEIDSVINFAGYKAVGESVSKPIEYYNNNLNIVFNLLEVMKEEGVKKMIFSSSATVYGEENPTPYFETMKPGTTTNPYGTSKKFIENILEDYANSNPEFVNITLRYFNPVGAHKSGLIGEDPSGIPNNLMPFIVKVANGTLEKLTIFGDDYDTEDGTCIRDYIHVMDLAEAHVTALEKISDPGNHLYNVGSGKGVSVKEMVETFENANGVKVNHEYGERRPGDLAVSVANVDKIKEDLGWETTRNVEDMCVDSWNFAKNNS